MKKGFIVLLSVFMVSNVSVGQEKLISPKQALIQAQAELDDTINQLELAQNQRQFGWIALGLSAGTVAVGAYRYLAGAIGSMWKSSIAEATLKGGKIMVIGAGAGGVASGGYIIFKSSEIAKIKEKLKLDRENVIRMQNNL